MNTIIKSAIFAAVIMFGGIYAVDALYNKSNTAADFANIEPAAGEQTDAAFGDIQKGMNAVAAEDAKAMVTNEEAKAKADSEVNQIASDADKNDATLNSVKEETDMMAKEAQDSAKKTINETEQAIDNATKAEPAAGGSNTTAE